MGRYRGGGHAQRIVESVSPEVTILCTQWVSRASNHARADFGGYRREEEGKHSPFQ